MALRNSRAASAGRSSFQYSRASSSGDTFAPAERACSSNCTAHSSAPRSAYHSPSVASAVASCGLAAIAAHPHDATALATLGEWYALRGADEWAVQLLGQARSAGANVSPLLLAREYWKLDRPADAAREFRSAIARAEAPADYLGLCLNAVTTAQPA